MNWWVTLVPVLVDLIKLWLEKRQPRGPGVAAAPPVALMSDAEADAMATRLEVVVAQAPVVAGAKGGTPAVGSDAGIIAHVQELIAALQARDWVKIGDLIKDFVNHL